MKNPFNRNFGFKSFLLFFIFSSSAQAIAMNSNEYVNMLTGWKKDGSNLIGFDEIKNQYLFSKEFYPAMKFYIPAGTTNFGMIGFMSPGSNFAIVSRMGQPPERKNFVQGDVNSGEYAQLNAAYDQSVSFTKLLAGQEQVVVHNGTGSTGLVGKINMDGRPTLKGVWLYTQIININSVSNFSANGFVDVDLYKNKIANVNISPEGVPAEDFVLPARPTGIKLVNNTIFPDPKGITHYIEPVGSNVVALGRCELDGSNPLANHISIENYAVKVLPSAPFGSIEIKCGDATDFTEKFATLKMAFSATLTVGQPVAALGIKLSSDKLIATNNPASITISSDPANAVLGECRVKNDVSNLVEVISNSVRLTEEGKKITAPVNGLLVECGSLSKSFGIQPGLTLTPSALTMNSAVSKVQVSAYNAGSSLSCSLVGANDFNPAEYLDWNPSDSSVSIKADAPALPKDQVVSVTCSDRSASLTLKAALPGLLYPLHNDDLNQSGSTKPPRAEAELYLRWKKPVDGVDQKLELIDNYPKLIADNKTNFTCSDTQNLFDFSSVAGESKATLKAAALTASVVTKIECFISDSSATGGVKKPTPGSEFSTASLLVDAQSKKWDIISAPTAEHPIIDVSQSIGSVVRLKVYVPKSIDDKSNVKTALMVYASFPYTSESRDLDWQAQFFLVNPENPEWRDWSAMDRLVSNVDPIVYTTLADSDGRVLDLSLLFSKSSFADFKAKFAVFHTTKNDSLSWSRMPKEWSSVNKAD